jgi:hypothetical protein
VVDAGLAAIPPGAMEPSWTVTPGALLKQRPGANGCEPYRVPDKEAQFPIACIPSMLGDIDHK